MKYTFVQSILADSGYLELVIKVQLLSLLRFPLINTRYSKTNY